MVSPPFSAYMDKAAPAGTGHRAIERAIFVIPDFFSRDESGGFSLPTSFNRQPFWSTSSFGRYLSIAVRFPIHVPPIPRANGRRAPTQHTDAPTAVATAPAMLHSGLPSVRHGSVTAIAGMRLSVLSPGRETMLSFHSLNRSGEWHARRKGNGMGTTLHGVNVDQLVGTVNAIKENPDLARFRFRAVTEWVDGGHSRTKIQGFYGAGIEDASRNSPFVLEGDEPPVLLGTNAGPNAVETVLSALASCLTVGIVYNAAARDIKVESLIFALEGDIDLQGFLGLSDRVRPGYQNIRLSCTVRSDAPREKLEELWEYVQRTSPVLDIVRNPVPVSLAIENA